MTKITDSPLDVYYESRRVQGGFVIERRASKRYRYIGLTLREARTMENVRVALYTRPYARVKDMGGGAYVFLDVPQLTSDISICLEAGNIYRLDVSVDERDEKFATLMPDDPATLFVGENARNYEDGDGDGEISIESAVFVKSENATHVVMVNGTTSPCAVYLESKQTPTTSYWYKEASYYLAPGTREVVVTMGPNFGLDPGGLARLVFEDSETVPVIIQEAD